MPIRALVTGGTGFVGYWLKQTQPGSLDVTYLSREDYNRGEWKDNHYELAIHAANIPPHDVLKVADRILYLSSGAVYWQNTEYAANKRSWERVCTDSGKDVLIARLFCFIGAHLKNLYAVTNFIEDAKAGRPITIRGNGSAVRSYLHGQDLGMYLWLTLYHQDKRHVFDVGGITPYTILQVAYAVSRVIPAEINIMNEPGVQDFSYLPTNGIKENIGLTEAIERTIHESL